MWVLALEEQRLDDIGTMVFPAGLISSDMVCYHKLSLVLNMAKIQATVGLDCILCGQRHSLLGLPWWRSD